MLPSLFIRRWHLFGLIFLALTISLLFGFFFFKSPTQNLVPPILQAKLAPTSFGWEAKLLPVVPQFASFAIDGKPDTLDDPFGIVIDAAGNTFVADAGEHNRILKFARDGRVQVFAGGVEGYLDTQIDAQGNALAAQFQTPSGLALDAQGNLLVADTGNHVIRKISTTGVVTTLAGTGQAGFRDGKASEAQFNGPIGVAVAKDGRVFVADTYNDRIRVIGVDGMVATVAGGSATGYRDGAALEALFDTPSNLVIDSKGEIIVADTRNNALRKIDGLGNVSTIVASALEDHDALLRRPVGLAITHDDYLYVGEISHGRILQIAPNGEMRGLTGVDIDIIPGDDTSARLQFPVGLAVNKQGNLLATDTGKTMIHHIVRQGRVDPTVTALKASAQQSENAAQASSFPWPLLPQDRAHEVIGTMGEVRGDFGGDSRDHFHRGLDMQAAMGDAVVAVKDEKISLPVSAWAANSINEGLRLNKFSYVHMRVGRGADDAPLDGQKFQLIKDEKDSLQHVRIRRGTRFHVGEKLGTVNRRYHVHLNYAPHGDVVNPMSLGFIGFEDHIAPQIVSIHLADKDGAILAAKPEKNGRKKSASVLTISRAIGELNIIVDAFDQADGNAARRRLGVYSLAYQILDEKGVALAGFEKPHMNLRFDRLPTDEEAVKVAYAESSGITVHGNATTKFIYNLTNEVQDGHAKLGFLSIKDLAAGEYRIRVFAADFAGNVARQNTELRFVLE